MKFKVSPKDLVIFIAFCILLLFLSSLGVSNFSYFANYGKFAGLNPFLGFTAEYIGGTIIVFLIILIVIFASVSSYIFKREKGIGLDLGEKDEKGYSRWSTDKEIKTDKNIERIIATVNNTSVAGIPLINNGKDIWVDNGEYHNLIIGATGSGKTETIVKPMVNILAKNGESMIIMDPKGEIYKYSGEYLKERGYKIKVLNFREPHLSNAWNPLTLPYQYLKGGNEDKATELLDDVALNILYDPNNKGEPFWEKSASDYFSGIVLGLFEDAKEEEININSVSLIGNVGEERFAASNYIKEYFSLKGEDSTAYTFASGTINAPNETRGGITSVFRQKIRQFASREQLSEMLSYSDFDMRDIGKEKTAIFIVIHDEKTTYHSLATIFIKQCYETLIDQAQQNGGKLPFRTNFILDEFANMPPLKDVDAMVTAARSRDIRFTFIVQNFGQLKDIYGEKAGTIKGNCGNLVYLLSTELESLEEISKMAGEIKSKKDDKTASTPLITVTDLQKMKQFEAVILRWRKYPFKTKYTPDFKMTWGAEKKLAEFTPRETKEIKIFDLKSFVKEEKRKKLFETMDNPERQMMNNFDMPPRSPYPPGFGGGMEAPNPMMPPGAGGFDIDAMIKSIDEKIAALDKEEEERKKALTEKTENELVANVKEAEVRLPEQLLQKEAPVQDTVVLEPATKIKEEVQEPKELKVEESLPIEQEIKKELVEEKNIEPDFQEEIIKQSEVVQEPQAVETENPKEKVEETKPVVKVDADSVIINENIITDDEFFDDFFGDDA